MGGMQTDPWRIQVYREMLRLREECIEQGTCVRSSTAMLNMTRWLAKISEHTQGVQNEGWSPGVPGSSTSPASCRALPGHDQKLIMIARSQNCLRLCVKALPFATVAARSAETISFGNLSTFLSSQPIDKIGSLAG